MDKKPGAYQKKYMGMEFFLKPQREIAILGLHPWEEQTGSSSK